MSLFPQKAKATKTYARRSRLQYQKTGTSTPATGRGRGRNAVHHAEDEGTRSSSASEGEHQTADSRNIRRTSRRQQQEQNETGDVHEVAQLPRKRKIRTRTSSANDSPLPQSETTRQDETIESLLPPPQTSEATSRRTSPSKPTPGRTKRYTCEQSQAQRKKRGRTSVNPDDDVDDDQDHKYVTARSPTRASLAFVSSKAPPASKTSRVLRMSRKSEGVVDKTSDRAESTSRRAENDFEGEQVRPEGDASKAADGMKPPSPAQARSASETAPSLPTYTSERVQESSSSKDTERQLSTASNDDAADQDVSQIAAEPSKARPTVNEPDPVEDVFGDLFGSGLAQRPPTLAVTPVSPARKKLVRHMSARSDADSDSASYCGYHLALSVHGLSVVVDHV